MRRQAANLVDSFSGQGIFQALSTAQSPIIRVHQRRPRRLPVPANRDDRFAVRGYPYRSNFPLFRNFFYHSAESIEKHLGIHFTAIRTDGFHTIFLGRLCQNRPFRAEQHALASAGAKINS